MPRIGTVIRQVYHRPGAGLPYRGCPTALAAQGRAPSGRPAWRSR